MSYCRYCTMLDNGDYPDDYKYLLDFRSTRIHEIQLEGGDIDLDYTIDGVPFEHGILVKREKIMELESAVNGCVGIDKNCISISLWNDKDTTDDFYTKSNINFCPMCGRKL